MKKRRIYFHVGLPKSASTWMQSIAFPNLKSINYIGRSYEIRDPEKKIGKPPKIKDRIDFILTHLSKAHPHSYDEVNVQKVIKNSLHTSLPNVLSTEHLSEPSNYLVGANRIKKVFPNSHIILLIRSQDTIIPSIYLNELRKGCTETLSKLLNTKSENRQRIIGTPEIWLDHYNYLKMYDFYVSLFGSDRVLMLPIELLRYDLESFVTKMTSFLGVEYNSAWHNLLDSSISVNKAGISLAESTAWLTLNRLALISPQFLRSQVKRRQSKLIKLTRWAWGNRWMKKSKNHEIELIRNRFAVSNRSLSKKIDIDLKLLDYPVE